MNRTVFGLLFIIMCVMFGRCTYSYFEAYNGFCADRSPQPPERELYYLTFSERALKNKKIVRAFKVAASRWRAVGITITPVENNKQRGGASAHDIILADINVKQCSDKNILGWGYFERKNHHKSGPVRRANLCADNLEAIYSDDWLLLVSVAQHELGHALGLWHHYGSVMKPGCRVCPDPGFTESDMNTIYSKLLIDRKITHPEYCSNGRP